MLKLIYATEYEFLVEADIDGLLALSSHQFYTCNLTNCYTENEMYHAFTQAEIENAWDTLCDLPPSFQHAVSWRGNYLLDTAGGLRSWVRDRGHLAAVITAGWNRDGWLLNTRKNLLPTWRQYDPPKRTNRHTD
jgi:hypothetical protein